MRKQVRTGILPWRRCGGPPRSACWYLFRSGARPAAENMALDEALLESAPGLGRPVLRFYGWTEPAASFGYFQRHAEVEKLTPLRPLVRRPTGGGVVPHDSDWTYSLIFPPANWWYSLKAIESYRQVHEWIRDAFAGAGIATQLAPMARKVTPGHCFAGAEQFDLLWDDRKIAGAAQRRSRLGLLIQGSIQPPPGITGEKWLESLCAVAEARWSVHWAPFKPAPELQRRAAELAAGKYARLEYNERK